MNTRTYTRRPLTTTYTTDKFHFEDTSFWDEPGPGMKVSQLSLTKYAHWLHQICPNIVTIISSLGSPSCIVCDQIEPPPIRYLRIRFTRDEKSLGGTNNISYQRSEVCAISHHSWLSVWMITQSMLHDQAACLAPLTHGGQEQSVISV